MQDLLEIVRADFAKNHIGREYDLHVAEQGFTDYARLGLPFVVSGLVIIFVTPKTDGVVEFHCMNKGDGKDLSAAVIGFLKDAAAAYETAVTYYDNPRVSNLMKFSQVPVTVTKIDAGLDKTYEARFTLRS